jgi:lysophospholipase L1-like esterase
LIQKLISRLFIGISSIVLTLSVLLLQVPPTFAATHSVAAQLSLVGPKTYYLALGDSLAFGFQPNLDFHHGYADDFYTDLKSHGVTATANMGCPDETTKTMINGSCPGALLRRYPYVIAQLSAAVAYLHAHAGKVSPVTLDIGANDLIPDLNASTCAVSSNWASDLATVDSNLTQVILPQLVAAMTVDGKVTGDLLLMNYYDPYQNRCPNTVPYIQQINQHLAADANSYATLVDVFDPFGGATTPNPNICTYTWMCSHYPTSLAIHGTTTGYSVMASAFEQAAGY